MDPGNGTEAIERFWYDNDLNCCFAFKYTGSGGNLNNYRSQQDCSTCAYTDIGMCEQFKDSTVDTRNATEKSDEDEKCREDIYCPKGYVCRNQAFGNYWCFNATIAHWREDAHSERCPDGSQARGTKRADMGGWFEASFGRNCSEMLCGDDEQCFHDNPHFAKCCKKT
ncbi:serine protease inhibitor precursor [Aphelenchoides avenae]|nr:serine protease inhibitor precursor [Aphelenchus avenae]